MTESIIEIEKFINEKRFAHVITLNAEIAYQAIMDKELSNIINQADLVTPDGIGIVWSAKLLGYKVRERVTGIDLMLNICGQAPQKNWSIYLFGAAPNVAEKAGQNLEARHKGLNILASRDGFFKPEQTSEIINDIKNLSPDIIFIALGAPRQEEFIARHRNDLGSSVCIGVGGSFDVIAGIKRRAPNIFIKLNLEWLYRLINEPSRFKRQLAIPKFILAVLRDKLAAKN